MKTIFTTLLIVVTLTLLAVTSADAQRRRNVSANRASAGALRAPREVGSTAIVIDETLSVLRTKPSLFSEAIQRMRRGRVVKILATAEADGVRFYRVAAPPANSGWVQADAVFGKFRPGDEERLARLVQASDGFDQVEIAYEFLNLYRQSQLRPSILLLYGDLLEETAVKLTRDSATRLSRREMAASAAPVHSYFLNFVSLDRYRKLGITFLFNPVSRAFHYDGASWNEIVAKHAASSEAVEAAKRLDALKQKMDTTAAKQAQAPPRSTLP
jgi:hypothetical protein